MDRLAKKQAIRYEKIKYFEESYLVENFPLNSEKS